jgi:hypothetical protein
MRSYNGKVMCEYYRGTRLVYAPPVKWYYFSLPYSSEVERVLEPASNHEEEAILVAPDNFTALMLKIESFGSHIPIVMGEKQARKQIDERLSQNSTRGNGI